MKILSQSPSGIVALFLFVTPIFATPVSFAEFVHAISNQGYTLTVTHLGAGLFNVHIAGSGLVNFTYLVPGTPFDGSAQTAILSFDATSTFAGSCATGTDLSCNQNNDAYTEAGYSGNFSITRMSPFLGLSNLLSGTFNALAPGNPNRSGSGGKLTSTIGGSDGAFQASQTTSNPSQVTLASDFLNFNGSGFEDATFSFSSMSPAFSVAGSTGAADGFPNNLTAAGAGTFSSQLMPSVLASGPAALVSTPEPDALILIGSALIGLSLISRRKFA